MGQVEPSRGTEHRGTQVALVVLTGFVLGICGGVLTWLDGGSVAEAVLTGASVWAGAILLFLALLHFVRGTGG